MMSMIAAIFALGLQVAAPVDLDAIREKSGLPALGAAVLTSDRILWQGVSGVRRVGERASAQLNDKWHLGSCGKAMTVYLVARLVAEGKLTWESTPRQVFGSRLPETVTALADVPLNQFLTHRAGVPNQASIRRFDAAAGGPDRAGAVFTILSLTPLSAPGETYRYSNMGYIVAGGMAEAVTGQSYESLMKTRVFDPLGITTAGFGNMAQFEANDQPWPHRPPERPMPNRGSLDNPRVFAPAGTIHMSLADWAKFIQEFLRSGRGQSRLLPPDVAKALHHVEHGATYGRGWMIADRAWAGGRAYLHAGSNTMNYAMVWVAPALDRAYLVVTNSEGERVKDVADEVVQALVQSRR